METVEVIETAFARRQARQSWPCLLNKAKTFTALDAVKGKAPSWFLEEYEEAIEDKEASIFAAHSLNCTEALERLKARIEKADTPYRLKFAEEKIQSVSAAIARDWDRGLYQTDLDYLKHLLARRRADLRSVVLDKKLDRPTVLCKGNAWVECLFQREYDDYIRQGYQPEAQEAYVQVQ